jgi:hypothetical protein
MRKHLPGRAIGVFPKGNKDCGDHQWYKESQLVDRCYHCKVGERRPSQFDQPEVSLRDLYGIPPKGGI